MKIVISDLDELSVFAKSLSQVVRPGLTINLVGEIGAGKTALTKLLLHHLGVTDVIKSPTYTIVNQYDVDKFRVYHADVYRIVDEDELYNIGFEDYFSRKTAMIVEWGDMYRDYIKELSFDYMEIEIKVDEMLKRHITITSDNCDINLDYKLEK